MATRRVHPYGRVLRWSLVASVLVHLLILLISPIFIQTEHPPGGQVPLASDEPTPFGIEAIEVVASEDAPETPPAEEVLPDEVPSFQPPPVMDTSPDDGQPATPGAQPPVADQPPTTARDALQPGYRDPRLYVAPRPLPDVDRTDHERYMEHLQARIDAVNDSMGVAARRNSSTSDWTVTDEAGNRWGLSPDGLHLGGVTIPRALLPLPGATGDNQSIEAQREAQRQRDEIRRQEDDRERARTREDRIEATREANDAQRGDGS